jgi:hypothetical protein
VELAASRARLAHRGATLVSVGEEVFGRRSAMIRSGGPNVTDDLAERVKVLERKANWLRRWVLALSAALVAVGVAGASGPKELTLRKLTIEDDKGKPRGATAGAR